MSLKIQLRRDIASNWIQNNPLLLNGEIGIETDTLKFKIGNGSQRWNDITSYALKPGLANGVATLNSFGKIPLSQIPDQVSLDAEASAAIISALNSITTSDIEEGSNLYFTDSRVITAIAGVIENTLNSAEQYADSAIAIAKEEVLSDAYSDATTKANSALYQANLHSEGFISNAINLLNTSDIEEGSNLYFTNSRVDNRISFITEPLFTDATNYVDSQILNTTSYIDSAIQSVNTASSTDAMPEGTTNLYFTPTRARTAVANVISTPTLIASLSAVDELKTEVQTNLDTALLNYIPASQKNNNNGVAGLNSTGKIEISQIMPGLANLSGSNFTGDVSTTNLTVTGNLTVNGTTTTVNATNLELTDSIIYLGSQNVGNSMDLGIVGHFTSGNYQHTGFVRDASDGKWKLFSNVSTEPSNQTLDFTSATYDTLKIGALESSSATIGNVSNTEIQYLEGVTSSVQTQLNSKASLSSPIFSGIVTIPSGALIEGYATSLDLTSTLEAANGYTDEAISTLGNSLGTIITDADRNQMNGFAGLDSNTKILSSVIPTITNSLLQNSSITINGSAVSLGSSVITGYTNGISGSNVNKITYGTSATPPSSGNSAGDIYIQY